MYVLDTNTLIYFFKGQGQVAERLLSVAPKEVGIPAIVVFEIEYGIRKSNQPRKRQEQFRLLCAAVNILPFNDTEASHVAAARVKLEKKGTPIGQYDLLIAGTALSNNGILVTNNTREFARVPGLRLENWFG